MEFKVEVTCSGEKINNAEVKVEIIPDNKEITFTRYEDGKYKASERFTTSGVRNINFSVTAPFYISAKIKGNSIEIKDEDYELKKAVEDFASDNIEILQRDGMQ